MMRAAASQSDHPATTSRVKRKGAPPGPRRAPPGPRGRPAASSSALARCRFRVVQVPARTASGSFQRPSVSASPVASEGTVYPFMASFTIRGRSMAMLSPLRTLASPKGLRVVLAKRTTGSPTRGNQ